MARKPRSVQTHPQCKRLSCLAGRLCRTLHAMPFHTRIRTEAQRRSAYEQRRPRYCLLDFEEFKQQVEAFPPYIELDARFFRVVGVSMAAVFVSGLAMAWLISSLRFPLVSVPASQLYAPSSVHFIQPANYSYNLTAVTGSFSMFAYHEDAVLNNVSALDGSVVPSSYSFDSGLNGRCVYSVYGNVTSIYVYPPSSRSDNSPLGDKWLQLSLPACGGLWVARLSLLVLTVLVALLTTFPTLTAVNQLLLSIFRDEYERDQRDSRSGPSAVSQPTVQQRPFSSSSLSIGLRSSLLIQPRSHAEPAGVDLPAVARAPMPSQQQMTNWHLQRSQSRFRTFRRVAAATQALAAAIFALALIELIAAPAWASNLGYAGLQWTAMLYVHVVALVLAVALMPALLLLTVRSIRSEERLLMDVIGLSSV